MEQLDKFIKDFDVEPLEIEVTCWNSTIGHAGTADLIARIGGEIVLLDLKTGKSGIYPDVALQLAAYGHAEFIISPDGSRREMPELGGAAAPPSLGCFLARPEGCLVRVWAIRVPKERA